MEEIEIPPLDLISTFTTAINPDISVPASQNEGGLFADVANVLTSATNLCTVGMQTDSQDNITTATSLDTIMEGSINGGITNQVDMTNNQSQGGDYQCTECNKNFKTMNSLNRHRKRHDGTMKTCHLCPKKFYSPGDLTNHIKAIHYNQKLRCSECEKSFFTKCGFKRHMEEHTGLFRYRCHICGRGFAYKQLYTDHVNVHTGTRPYKCTKCPASFLRLRDCSFHISLCQVEKCIDCEVCGKKFKSKKYLTQHMNIHDNPGHYQCALCGQQFAHRGSLKNYDKRKHWLNQIELMWIPYLCALMCMYL